MTRDELELIRDHAEAFVDAVNRASQVHPVESLHERETLIGLHNAIVQAFEGERVKGYAA